jgi:hypothetical protein
LKHSIILKPEKYIGNTKATNDIWEITKSVTERLPHHHTSAIRPRNGLTHTRLVKARVIPEVYKTSFDPVVKSKRSSVSTDKSGEKLLHIFSCKQSIPNNPNTPNYI